MSLMSSAYHCYFHFLYCMFCSIVFPQCITLALAINQSLHCEGGRVRHLKDILATHLNRIGVFMVQFSQKSTLHNE